MVPRFRPGPSDDLPAGNQPALHVGESAKGAARLADDPSKDAGGDHADPNAASDARGGEGPYASAGLRAMPQWNAGSTDRFSNPSRGTMWSQAIFTGWARRSLGL